MVTSGETAILGPKATNLSAHRNQPMREFCMHYLLLIMLNRRGSCAIHMQMMQVVTLKMSSMITSGQGSIRSLSTMSPLAGDLIAKVDQDTHP